MKAKERKRFLSELFETSSSDDEIEETLSAIKEKSQKLKDYVNIVNKYLNKKIIYNNKY